MPTISLAAALVYWVIVLLWLTVLATLLVFYVRNPRVFGTTRLLLAVVAIDTMRNIVENIYFGVYFGGQYGIFPVSAVDMLGKPYLLVIPKLLNVIAGCVVLGLLLLRWLPAAVREHKQSEQNVADLKILATTDGALQPAPFRSGGAHRMATVATLYPAVVAIGDRCRSFQVDQRPLRP
jgi:hypothetical protein